LSAFTKAIALN